MRKNCLVVIDIVIAIVIGLGILPSKTYAVNKLSFIHSDHLGSTSLVTDEQGNVVSQQAYYPYGATRNHQSSNPNHQTEKRYTGQVSDQEQTGLYYYNARYYDPTTAKFTQADTINNDDLNRYLYVGGNPTSFNDPTGHCKGLGCWLESTFQKGAEWANSIVTPIEQKVTDMATSIAKDFKNAYEENKGYGIVWDHGLTYRPNPKVDQNIIIASTFAAGEALIVAGNYKDPQLGPRNPKIIWQQVESYFPSVNKEKVTVFRGISGKRVGTPIGPNILNNWEYPPSGMTPEQRLLFDEYHPNYPKTAEAYLQEELAKKLSSGFTYGDLALEHSYVARTGMDFATSWTSDLSVAQRNALLHSEGGAVIGMRISREEAFFLPQYSLQAGIPMFPYLPMESEYSIVGRIIYPDDYFLIQRTPFPWPKSPWRDQ